MSRGRPNSTASPVMVSTEATIMVSVLNPERPGPASPPRRNSVIRGIPKGTVVVVVGAVVVVEAVTGGNRAPHSI